MVGNSLKRISFEELPAPEVRLTDSRIDAEVAKIIDGRAGEGERGVRVLGRKVGRVEERRTSYLGQGEVKKAWERLDKETAGVLERAHGRVAAFAAAQRGCLKDLDVAVPGGRAGHEFVPVGRAGCYVPGGRYPLPSSAIMTVTAASEAGVPEIWCAGPNPTEVTLAAAYISGAQGYLACGGAQAIAALCFGVVVPRCDTVVGPGGRYVASAKRQLFGLWAPRRPQAIRAAYHRKRDCKPRVRGCRPSCAGRARQRGNTNVNLCFGEPCCPRRPRITESPLRIARKECNHRKSCATKWLGSCGGRL